MKSQFVEKDPDAGKEETLLTKGRRRRGQWKIRWLDSITDSMYMILSKLREKVKDRV